MGRFVVDLVRADGELVEVQTGGFGALGNKLDALLDEHRIRVVHPVAAERRIVRVDEHGQVLGARRSPKRETAVAVFDKLVAFPSLLTHPNLTIEVLLLREDHIRRPQPTPTRRSHPRSGGATAGRGPRPGRAAHAGGHPRGAARAAARAVQHARARGPAPLQHAVGAAHALLPADDRDRRAGGQARPRPAARAHGAGRNLSPPGSGAVPVFDRLTRPLARLDRPVNALNDGTVRLTPWVWWPASAPRPDRPWSAGQHVAYLGLVARGLRGDGRRCRSPAGGPAVDRHAAAQ